jgi:hypothetical protein
VITRSTDVGIRDLPVGLWTGRCTLLTSSSWLGPATGSPGVIFGILASFGVLVAGVLATPNFFPPAGAAVVFWLFLATPAFSSLRLFARAAFCNEIKKFLLHITPLSFFFLYSFGILHFEFEYF